MAAGISIGVAADTRAFSMGVKNGVVQPLEDVEKALDKVDDASDKAGDALVSDLKGAQKSTEKLADEYKDLGDVIKRESREAGRNIDRNIKDGTDGAKEGLDEFKDEANSTAKESAASFDGSADSIVGSFQEIAANAFAGFGPLGAAAGLAAAAGIGVGFAKMQEDAEATEERVSAAFDDMIESGLSYVSAELVNENLKVLANDTDKLAAAQKDAASLGVDLSIVLQAQAGDQDALNQVNAAANEKYAAIRDRQREIGETGAPIPGELNGQATAAENLANKYQGLAGDLSTAAGRAQIFRDAAAGVAAQSGDAANRVQSMKDQLAAIQDKTITFNADTGAVEQYMRDLAARKVTVAVDLQARKSGDWVD